MDQGTQDEQREAEIMDKKTCLTQGSDKADELEKLGADRDGAENEKVVAKDVEMCRGKIFAALTYAAEFHEKVEECDDMDEVQNIG